MNSGTSEDYWVKLSEMCSLFLFGGIQPMVFGVASYFGSHLPFTIKIEDWDMIKHD